MLLAPLEKNISPLKWISQTCKVWENGTILISVKSIWYEWGLQHGTDSNKLSTVCSVFWNGLNLSFYWKGSIMLMSYKFTFGCCSKVKRGYQFLYSKLGQYCSSELSRVNNPSGDAIHVWTNFQGLCNGKFL